MNTSDCEVFLGKKNTLNQFLQGKGDIFNNERESNCGSNGTCAMERAFPIFKINTWRWSIVI